jgi:hypothetical protein
MNNRQESKLRMYKGTHRVLHTNKTLVDSIPALAREAANFEVVIAEIEGEHKKQAIDSKGITVSRDQVREDLTEDANMMAGALFSYAKHKGDADLCQRTNVYPSTLMRSSQADFIRITSEIAGECQKAGASLSDYGPSADAIAKYVSRVELYKQMSTMPRNAKVEKVTATSNLDELFRKCDDILLNHIDTLVVQFKKTAPNFFKDYDNARIIVDQGNRKDKDKKKETPAV